MFPLFAAFVVFLPRDTPLTGVVYLCVGVTTYVLYVRLWEHRPVRELGGGPSAAAVFALGVGAGLLFTVIRAGIGIGTGLLSLGQGVHWQSFTSSLAEVVILLVSVVVFEELLCRGVILRYAELWLGSWAALGLSSLFFAAMHFVGGMQSPGLFADRLSTGLVFGAAYLLTRRLWLSIGLHLGLNLGVVLTVGHFGVTPVLVLWWNGSPSIWLLKPVLALVLTGILLVLAQHKGRLSKSHAWRLQCGMDAGELPPQSSGTNGPSRAEEGQLTSAST